MPMHDLSAIGDPVADRQAILSSMAHVRLVSGDPGAGKTYFGCQLADHELRTGKSSCWTGRSVLFLTFARNAVAQIRRAFMAHASSLESSILENEHGKAAQAAVKRVRIDTFGAFCWWLVTAYARYLPDHGDGQPWLLGRQAVGGEYVPEGHIGYTFEQLHEVACRILEIPAIRSLVSDTYPLVIVDEHQDVDPILHRIIVLLCKASRAVLLRGPGQSVYGSMKGFDPGAILEQTMKELSPPAFVLRSMGGSKTRHRPELAAFLKRYDSGDQYLYSPPHTTLKTVPRLNKNGNPNSLETFAGLAVQAMKKQLGATSEGRPTICVLTSTNGAAARVQARLMDGSVPFHLFPVNATLLLKEDVLMQYGRLLFVLLKDHWIARSRSAVEIESTAVSLKALAASTSQYPSSSDIGYVKLAEYIAEKVKGFKKPRPGQSSSEKLANDLVIRLGKLLRETKGNLPSGSASTPFSKHDTAFLSHLAAELLSVVGLRIGGDGRLDIAPAHLAFEKSIRQRVLLEKVGISSRIQVMTIHKAKGREFDGTVLVLEDDPRAIWRSRSGIPDTEQIDLYRVGLSRARERVAVIAFEDASEEIATSLSHLIES